jgi:hypothetical protein
MLLDLFFEARLGNGLKIMTNDGREPAILNPHSVGIIQNHYLNMNVPEADALKLYELTPEKAKELGIIP